MRKPSLKMPKNKLLVSLTSGVICLVGFKAYLYVTDRQQFNDSNLLVSLFLVLIAAALIYFGLSLASYILPKTK